MKSIKSLLVLAMLAAQPAVAAGKIVFDPTNYGKNTLTAMQTAQSVALESQQYATQIKQFQVQLQNIQQLDGRQIAWAVDRGLLPAAAAGQAGMNASDAIAAAAGVYQNVVALRDTVRAMANTYGDLNAWSTDLLRQVMLGEVPAEKILAYEANALKAGRTQQASNLNQLSMLTGQLQNQQARADRLAAMIPNISGNIEGLQTLAAQNHLLSDQLAGIQQAAMAGASSIGMSEADRLRDREKSDLVADEANKLQRRTWSERK